MVLHGLFNSVIFMFVNLSFGLYMFRRFFWTMKFHNKLVDEVAEFNYTASKARSCLGYIGTKVSEAMKEIETDIDRELQITQGLTQLSAKLSEITGRYLKLEETVIEIVRTDYNMESIKTETPQSINDEVKKLLSLKQPENKKGKSQKKGKFSTTTFSGVTFHKPSNDAANLSSKLFSVPSATETNAELDEACSEDKWSPCKRKSVITPVVQLLSEQKPPHDEKPIGFRPSWKYDS